jgi:hypothetical protein
MINGFQKVNKFIIFYIIFFFLKKKNIFFSQRSRRFIRKRDFSSFERQNFGSKDKKIQIKIIVFKLKINIIFIIILISTKIYKKSSAI